MPRPTAQIDVRILDEPVAYAPLAMQAGAGGECVFLGRTRADRHDEHGALVRLSYEAYRPMAMSVLRDLAERAARDFECFAVRVHHAVGEVPPGEASVLVQVAAAHRAAAFAACRFLIDSLKAEAPIWKREEWSDGWTWSEGTVVRAGGWADEGSLPAPGSRPAQGSR